MPPFLTPVPFVTPGTVPDPIVQGEAQPPVPPGNIGLGAYTEWPGAGPFVLDRFNAFQGDTSGSQQRVLQQVGMVWPRVWPGAGPFMPSRFQPRPLDVFGKGNNSVDATGGFSAVAAFTDQCDYGFLGPEDGDPLLNQPTNMFDFSPNCDVTGCFRSYKPQGITTVAIILRIRISDPLVAGQRLDLNVIVQNSDNENDGSPLDAWTHGLTINPDVSAELQRNWHTFTFYFKGFPTQPQFLNCFVVRRATPWSGDLTYQATNPPNVQIFVAETTVRFLDPSNAPATRKGYGTLYGGVYGLTTD